MADHMNLSVYLSQLAEGEKNSDDDDDTKSDEQNDEKIPENAVKEEKTEKDGQKDGKTVNDRTDLIHQTLKVYYKKRKVQTKTDNATQEFLKKQLDLKLKVRLNILLCALLWNTDKDTESTRAQSPQGSVTQICISE